MKKIQPTIDTFYGVNNALNPCSVKYKQSMAYKAQNSRINESGIWDKAPALVDSSMGTVVKRGVPVNLTPATTTVEPVASSHTHFKECNILDTQMIAMYLNYNSYLDVGPNKYGYIVDDDIGGSRAPYWWDGVARASIAGFVDNATVCNYDVAGMGRPTGAIAVADNGNGDRGGRMERGTYYYMYTYYDTVRKCESLPSDVVDWVAADWAAAGGAPESAIYPVISVSADGSHDPATGSGRYNANTKVRIYRSKRTYEAEYVVNPPNVFYYVGEFDYDTNAANMKLSDYTHDREIERDMYEGRGTPPPTAVDCLCSFNNRMYYFIGNKVYWSSAGRPEEVAQDYTLTYTLTNPNGTGTQTTTVPMQAKIGRNTYGEAIYEISELAGKTIIGAYPLNGKLWIWTANTTGYLKATTASEGVKYTLVRRGIGLVSDKTLAHTPYGLFGADREGIWLIDNSGVLGRLSKGIIDIDSTTKGTYFKQSTLTDSFGVWVPKLEEYWWCAVNTGESTVCRQLAYQPARGIFGGVYLHPDLKGGCTFTSSEGVQCFLTPTTGTDGRTPSPTSKASLVQSLQFWMGQHSLGNIKENLQIEVIYESITADQDVAVTIYQNNIASITGAASFTGAVHNDDNLVGVVKPHGSGRMFLLDIAIPAACVAPIIAFGYIADELAWAEKKGR